MKRAWPVLLLVLAGVLRAALCFVAPDAIHPVDPAELDLLALARLLAAGDVGGVVDFLGRGAVVVHGGSLAVAATTALAGLLVGLDYSALKLSALCWSLAGTGCWVALGWRLGGRRAALLLGLALALPVPWASQWWLTAWGSHPEATLFPALWLLVRGPLSTGLLAGLGVGFAPVLWPTAAALLLARLRGLRAWAVALPMLALGWLPGQLGALAGPLAGVQASLREDPGYTLGGLLAHAFDGALFIDSVRELLPLPLVATECCGPAAAGDATAALRWLLTAGFGAALLLLLRHREGGRRDGGRRDGGRCPDGRLLAGLVVVHLLALVLLSPTRPLLSHRYLLPWLPGLLLAPCLLATRSRAGAWAWGALALLPSVLALPVYGRLLLRDAPADLRDWRPEQWLAVGLDRVPIAQVPAVNAWLDARGDAATEGLAAAWTRRWAYPVLGEPFPPVEPRAGIAGRLRRLTEQGADPAALAWDAGFGVGLLVDEDAARPFLLDVAPADAAAEGLAAGSRSAGR